MGMTPSRGGAGERRANGPRELRRRRRLAHQARLSRSARAEKYFSWPSLVRSMGVSSGLSLVPYRTRIHAGEVLESPTERLDHFIITQP